MDILCEEQSILSRVAQGEQLSESTPTSVAEQAFKC